MHEASLAHALVELALSHAKAADTRRVVRIVVEIGTLSHVDANALCFVYDLAARGTLLEGAALQIERPQGHAYCLDCEAVVGIDRRGDDCPDCGGVRLLAQGGDELRLKELEVE